MSRALKIEGLRVLLLLAVAGASCLACGRSPSESCSGPLNLEGDVVAPVRIFAPTPMYTEEARIARVQGVVIVQATIDCEGSVTSVVVQQGLPMGLSEATVEAVRRWRFEPATLNGVPVSVYYNLTINFRIQ
ncbi:MAG: energy transducer TonB [Thermoanaerobaculia bacterium]|nr:energy transducer TonB [Thermoanaerobaculia bacterium]